MLTNDERDLLARACDRTLSGPDRIAALGKIPWDDVDFWLPGVIPAYRDLAADGTLDLNVRVPAAKECLHFMRLFGSDGNEDLLHVVNSVVLSALASDPSSAEYGWAAGRVGGVVLLQHLARALQDPRRRERALDGIRGLSTRAPSLQLRQAARAIIDGEDGMASPNRKVFVSYVREDRDRVTAICRRLQELGIPVWRDVEDLLPGARWRSEIRQAIRLGSAFVAFFSTQSEHRDRSYMREELVEAVAELRLRSTTTPWLIPVRLDACDVPAVEIGGGAVLSDLQYIDISDAASDLAIARLASSLEVALLRDASDA